jgi:hypothetical protein
MRERWARMTPEQREKFRAGMYRCGRPVAPSSGAPQSEVPKA